MLSYQQIEKIAEKIVRARLPKADLERVIVEPTTDSSGNEALRITLVLLASAIKMVSGDVAVDLLVEIQQKLRSEGDERFPLVEYATEQELVSGNDQAGDD